MDDANRSLKRVITDYKDYIETTTKGPVVERAKVSDFGGVIVKEDQKVSTESLCYNLLYSVKNTLSLVYVLPLAFLFSCIQLLCVRKCSELNQGLIDPKGKKKHVTAILFCIPSRFTSDSGL